MVVYRIGTIFSPFSREPKAIFFAKLLFPHLIHVKSQKSIEGSVIKTNIREVRQVNVPD